MSDYVAVSIFAAFIVAFAVVSLGAARLLRPSRPDPVKLANLDRSKYERSASDQQKQ